MRKNIKFYRCIILISSFSLFGNAVFSQCVLSSSDDTEQEAIDCLTSCGCSEIEIPNGVTVTFSEAWDLTGEGVLTFTIKTGGKLEMPGNGANNYGLAMASGSSLIVEDTSDPDAITGGSGNGQIKITIGSTEYRKSDIDAIIEAGGADEAGLLPVELLYFRAQSGMDEVVLNWATASELNNDYFTLERSRDGINFEAIGRIDGNGTIAERINYNFIDANPFLGLSYYRLSQTDYDGTTEVFPLISVLFDPGKSIFTISPNPLESQVFKLKATGFGVSEQAELNILDLKGNHIEQKQIYTDQFGNIDAEVQLSKQLKKGTYILELISGDRKVSDKIVAQ